MRDTFEMIALSREYIFAPFNEEIEQRIERKKREYKAKYPRSQRPRYRIKTNFEPMALSSNDLGILRRLFLRKKRGYRIIDHLITIRLLGRVYRLFHQSYRHKIPKFARKSAMGIETVLK
jgi:hypothetical protein